MGGDRSRVARLRPAAASDRFAHWPRWAAWAAIAATVALLVAASLTATPRPQVRGHGAVPNTVASSPHSKPPKDRDLVLYAAIARHVRGGENYYDVAIPEQRAGHYPVRPGLAVRLPTLAFLTAALGEGGLFALATLIGLGGLLAWWRRLGMEPGTGDKRIIALLLLAVGALAGIKPQYILLHEVWAGLLLAVAVALHRPGHWRAAWFAVAAALAIRELALPFVLLLAASAAWRRDWREAAAWAALVAMFTAGLAWHLHEVTQRLLPSDRPSPPWLVFRGLGGWTGDLVESSVLQVLSRRVAAPLALLPLLGWAAWKTPLGTFCTLLFLGYGVFFMIAGRANNFYWALMVTPAWFVGCLFLPTAARSLARSAGLGRG